MNNVNQELISLISESQFISGEDKKIWQEAIDGLPESFCKDIFEFIKAYPDRIGLLTDNLKEKINAIKNQDLDKFENILNKDKQLLETIK